MRESLEVILQFRTDILEIKFHFLELFVTNVQSPAHSVPVAVCQTRDWGMRVWFGWPEHYIAIISFY